MMNKILLVLFGGLFTITIHAEQIQVLVQAEQEVKLSSGMSGRIESVLVKEGQVFAKGDTLLTFECQKQTTELSRVEAEHSAASSLFESKKQLQALEAGSQLELDLAKFELDKATASVDFFAAQLRSCRIEAPFSGGVAFRYVDVSEYAQEGNPLLDVVDRSQLLAKILLPANNLIDFPIGREFTFYVDALAKNLTAKVIRLGASVNPVSQLVPVYANIINMDSTVLPGMIGSFEIGQKNP